MFYRTTANPLCIVAASRMLPRHQAACLCTCVCRRLGQELCEMKQVNKLQRGLGLGSTSMLQ